MSAGKVLVVGGTGHIGAPVARQLGRDGFSVRLLVRDVERASAQFGPEFEYVVGDVDDVASIDHALDGCTGVHVSLSGGSDPDEIDRVEHRGTARIAEQAARHGLSHMTYLSGDFAAAPEAERFPAERAKARAEQAIQQSGVPYTIFRPTYFMDTLPRHIQGRLAVVLGRQPHPLHMTAAGDFARMVSRSFQSPDARNRIFPVRGPEAVTVKDALRLYCSLVEPDKRVVTIPLWAMAAISRLFLKGELRRTLDTMRLLQRLGERDDSSEADRVLGPATTTVREWCAMSSGPSERRTP